MALWERIYCYLLIVIGLAGGCIATVIAFNNIFNSSMSVPCYVMVNNNNFTVGVGAH